MDRKLPLMLIISIISLIFMAGMVSAISIDYDTSIVQGQQWSVTIDASSLSKGEDETLLVDGSSVYVIGNVDGKIIGYETSSKVISSTINNSSVTVNLAGYSEGTYSIEIADVSGQVEFYKAVSQEEQEKTDDKISSMESTISSLNAEVKTMDETIGSLKTELSQKEKEITDLQNENASLLSSMHSLESNISSLEEEGKSKEEILSEVKSDLNILLTEREEALNSPIAGLFAFGADNSGLFIGLIALIAIVAVGLFVVKSKGTSIYSTSLFGNDNKEEQIETPEQALVSGEEKKGFFSNFLNKEKNKDEAETTSEKKGRWAVESYHPEENDTQEKKQENKNFELGDLIKKNN